MRGFILLIVALVTILPSLAQAYDVLVLQSRRDPSSDEVLNGFRLEQKYLLRTLVLSEYAEVDVVRVVREDRPRLILALGEAALKEARKIQNTQVLAVMALGVDTQITKQSNLFGISMFAAPDRYMAIFRSLKVRRVGVIHDPDRNSWYLNQARQAARQAGIELIVKEISTPRETLAQFATLDGRVDALWMLPDMTAVTRETTEAFFRFGRENSVPVISFAGSYIGMGAAAVLDIDRHALGRQAGSLASTLLSGERVGPPVVFPAKAVLKKNSSVLKLLRIESERIEGVAN